MKEVPIDIICLCIQVFKETETIKNTKEIFWQKCMHPELKRLNFLRLFCSSWTFSFLRFLFFSLIFDGLSTVSFGGQLGFTGSAGSSISFTTVTLSSFSTMISYFGSFLGTSGIDLFLTTRYLLMFFAWLKLQERRNLIEGWRFHIHYPRKSFPSKFLRSGLARRKVFAK